jgi:DNA-binding NarL/FixJ family response regulator
MIADDHHHFRVHLRNLLEAEDEWEVCGEAENGREAVEKHSSVKPHITVLDFNMPEMNGLHASRAILQKYPDAAILLLTIFASNELAMQAKKHGIRAFCSKVHVGCIPEAIKALLRGESYFPHSLEATAGN